MRVCSCGQNPYRVVGRPGPVSDPSETLELITEHRLHVRPEEDGNGWAAYGRQGPREAAVGPTICDAVRECVRRIKSAAP
jgi:hypothetical protein